MAFNFNKPFKHSNGNSARLLGKLRGDKYPALRYVVAVWDPQGYEVLCFYDETGISGSYRDLINIKEEEK